MEFKNKTVIITGASVGIGKATAIEFARNGANVMSSHVLKFASAETVLEIAYEQQRRGADIVKIVTAAKSVRDNFDYLPDVAEKG